MPHIAVLVICGMAALFDWASVSWHGLAFLLLAMLVWGVYDIRNLLGAGQRENRDPQDAVTVRALQFEPKR